MILLNCCILGGWRGIYATIPLFSGIINMATNKLAVWMIFSPLNFIGEFFRLEKGNLGWEGIG